MSWKSPKSLHVLNFLAFLAQNVLETADKLNM